MELRENSLGSITDMSLPRTNAVQFSSSASKRLFISYVYIADFFFFVRILDSFLSFPTVIHYCSLLDRLIGGLDDWIQLRRIN